MEIRRLEPPANYFVEEERDGFVVASKMKRAWAVQLQVLFMIDEICLQNGIRWWADFGTLLGAIRHRGFIPWDDDIDIAVPREDYMRLIPLLAAGLPSFCKVWSIRLDPHYTMLSTFVANRENVDTGDSGEEAAITSFYYDCPYVTGVDIYPMDPVPADPEQCSLWVEILAAVYYAANGYDSVSAAGELEARLQNIEAAAGVQLPRGEASRYALWALADQLSMIWPREEAQGVLWTPELVTCASDRVRTFDTFDRFLRLPFEYWEVPVPAGYAAHLHKRFGSWYTAQQGGSAHDYPFYKKQDAYINRH